MPLHRFFRVRYLFLFSTFFLLSFIDPSGDYSGDNLTSVLGKNSASLEVKSFANFWLLESDWSNMYGGLKLSVSKPTSTIDTIWVAGKGYGNLMICTSPLPFGILLSDDKTALTQKVKSEPILVENNLLFETPSCIMQVLLNKDGSIQALKFFLGKLVVKPLEKERQRTNYPPPPPVNTKLESAKKALYESAFSYNDVAKEIPSVVKKSTPFKQAIDSIFDAYKNSGLKSIKGDLRTRQNFWNYKYTYSTKIKVPGELFNMIYSFPFSSSQLDFVSIVQESNAIDNNFIFSYKTMEKELALNLTEEEGWSIVRTSNKESKILSDVEFKNSKKGSVILDYSRNPSGKNILYLRFLFFSD